MPYLAELRARLTAFAAHLRRRRAFPDLLEAEIQQDVLADATREQGRAGRLAYTAEQADLEASRLLRQSLADGHITPAEIPALRTALKHITRSAAHDHTITELMS